MTEKLGVAIITYNRCDMFVKSLRSIPVDRVDTLVIVNDGTPYDSNVYSTKRDPKEKIVIENSENLGVCKSKNIAFKHLLDKKCEYIFIIEDDIFIKNKDVFDKYIDAYKRTNIHHFSFMGHGPANRRGISHGPVVPRLIIEYPNTSIALAHNCVGAFCFYTRKCLEDVGLFDERFYQAFDHVEHTYRLAKAGYTTPYWWFADINNSWDYLDEIACSEENSVIRFENREKWIANIQNAAKIFKEKHGYLPAWSEAVPDTPQNQVLEFLKNIRPHD